MFTREYLQSLATATVFSRGKDYFRSKSVGRITREGDKFTAKVHGSYPYKVQLTLRAGGAKLKCNCPYDFDGICKHAVALGLAVLEEFGPRLAASGAAAPAFSPAALEAALRSAPAEVQLTFLADALRRDKALAQQFLAHAGPALAASAPAPPAAFTIDSISTEVYEALSDLAFDREMLDDYDPDFADYRHEEDALHDAANEAIAAVLLPHAEAVGEALHAGRLAEALRRWVGVYEGSAAATEPAADDYELFGYDDYPTHTQGRWLELLAEQQLPQLLETKHFAADEVAAALALLAGRYDNGQLRAQPGTKKPGRAPAAPAAPGPLALAPPAHFHDLLHALAHDPGAAAQLRPLLAAVPTPEAGLARVLLRVATVLADEPLWLRTSEAFAAHDANLATQLLDRYRASGDHASVRRVLGQLREKFSQPLNAYILRHLTLADDAALYLAALTQRCRHTHSLPDYLLLQAHWSPAQRRAFVDEQVALGARPGNNPLFGAELLVAENRPAELLPYLRRLQWAWQRAVPKVLALAAPTYPDDCLELVMERTETLLQDTSGRTRDHYQRIAAWLTALNAVAELRPPVALFAAHLYTEYARLAALREELRAARLVRTHLVGKQHKLVVSEEEDEEVRALLRDKQPPKAK
ncbi:MAG TPA: SWIM zinc finger family protein [Hymenobacter sp.]|uniref:SWIM zinc finger family protein n=1 Tax=Hymenobacter sp. TaxID=1898978 RepID=UPI002D7E9530|nr:SWIM zinc finger family protein [Hymenobacter sp.]HET9505780.1 SWIM zinc finger family protein [Hymenobacter sp.]